MSMEFLTGVVTPVATAGIVVAGSALVGPMISNTWKNRERQNELELKQREFKNAFVSEISESIMSIIVAVMRVEEWLDRKTQDTNEGYSESLYSVSRSEYGKFLVKSHIIQSRIRAYFISRQQPQYKDNAETLLKKWNSLLDFVKFVVQLSERKESNDREKYVGNPEPIEIWKIDELLALSLVEYNDGHADKLDIDDFKERLYQKRIEVWYEVKHAIVDRKNDVVDLVLDINVPLYSPGKISRWNHS